MSTMTEEEILADLESFEKEPVPEIGQTSSQKALISPVAQPQAETGEVPAEKTGPGEEDAGKDATAGTEPQATEEKPATERERDPTTGKFVKKAEEQPAKAEEISGKAEVPTEKPETSKYDKAKKEQERQKSLLAGFDEEKARFRAQAAAEKAEIERERQRIEEEKLKIRAQRNGQRPVDENGDPIYSSYELRELARDYRRRALKGEAGPNGEDYGEVSERAEVAAERAAKKEAQEQQALFERRQTQLAMEQMSANPELQDANSPLAQEIQAVFTQEAELAKKYDRGSIFRMIPDGFERALEVARLRQKAASAEEWKSKYEESQKEVDRLNSLTTLGSSSPVQSRQPKPQSEMTADELLDEMDKQAERQGVKLWKR